MPVQTLERPIGDAGTRQVNVQPTAASCGGKPAKWDGVA